MGAFEDFVNSNLGIRQPFISDFAPPTGDSKSTKAAGIRGSKFLDLSTNFLYEKTGENNNTDWIKIGELGEPRGGGGANLSGDQYIQFVSGSALVGSEDFIYQYGLGRVSGASGYYEDLDGISGHLTDELIVGELENDAFVTIEAGNVDINGSLSVSGPISNKFIPKYGLDIKLGSSPSYKGSSKLNIIRHASGHYRVSFAFNPGYTSIEDYQVIANISNTSASKPSIKITRDLSNIDFHITAEDGSAIDAGMLSVFIYNL